MGLPQLLLLGFYGIKLGINMSDHNKVKTVRVNFWTSLAHAAIITILLWWGGFFA